MVYANLLIAKDRWREKMKVGYVIFTVGAVALAAALLFKSSTTTVDVGTKKLAGEIRRRTMHLPHLDPKTVVRKDASPPFMKPLSDPSISDPWKKELYDRLDHIRMKCGELCTINSIEELEKRSTHVRDDLFPMVTVPNVDCPSILGMKEMDAGDLTFPTDIPTELQEYFSLSGAIPLSKFPNFFNQGYLEGQAMTNVWTKEDVDNMIQAVRVGTLYGTYGEAETNAVSKVLKSLNLVGKKVLVIGSERPWLESVLLSAGVDKITTLEYGSIESQHPQITTETPETFRRKYFEGELEMFDAVVSHSSIEHSGLGRYGDALNPWGDILTVARAWCLTKDDGFLYLSVPSRGDTDAVLYNAHRYYGKIRWPLVTANWMQVAKASGGPIETEGDFNNKGYVFRKTIMSNLKK